PRDERPRVRASKRLLAVERVQQVGDRIRIERDALALALVPEDPAESLRRRVADADLVCHAAQERFIHGPGGREAGREAQLAKEGKLDLAARRREVEVVDL